MKKAAVILFSIISFCVFMRTDAAAIKVSALAELEIVNAEEMFSGLIENWNLEGFLPTDISSLGEKAGSNFDGEYVFSNKDVEAFNLSAAILDELGRGIGITSKEKSLPFYEADGAGFQIFYMPADQTKLGLVSKLKLQEFIADDEAEGDEKTDELISDCLSSDKKGADFADELSLNIVIFTQALHYYEGLGSASSLSALSMQSSTMSFGNDGDIEIEITENFYGAGNVIGSIDDFGNIVLDIYYDNAKPVSIGFYEYKNSNFKLFAPKHINPHAMTIATADMRADTPSLSEEGDEKYIENIDVAGSPFLMALQNPAANLIFIHLNNLQNLNDEQDTVGFSLWAAPYYNYALGRNYLGVKSLKGEHLTRLQTKYSIESPGFALGADFLLGNGVIVGANAMLDMAQYFASGQSYNDGRLIRGAIYSGIRSGLDIMLFVGAGNWDFSQRRNGIAEYKARYGAKQYEAGLGFSKIFELSQKTRMRPFVDYEYISLSIDDYSEESKASYVIIYENRETRSHQARFGLFTDFNAAGSVSFTMGAYYRGLYGDRSSGSKISFAQYPYQDRIVIEHKLLQDSFGGEAILTISLGEDMNIVLDYTLLLNPQQENHKAQAMWTIKF